MSLSPPMLFSTDDACLDCFAPLAMTARLFHARFVACEALGREVVAIILKAF